MGESDKKKGLQRPVAEGCLSDLQLDRFLVEELSADEVAGLRAHEACCAACRGRLEVLRAEAFREAEDRLEARIAAARATGQVAFSEAPAWWRRLLWVPGVAAVAAAAVLAVVLALPEAEEQAGTPGTEGRGTGAPGVLLKGSQEPLGVYVKRHGRVRRAVSGEEFHAGDQVQFTYLAPGDGYVAVLGFDPVRSSCYVPSDCRGAVAVKAGVETRLEPGAELDATPGEEGILAVFCPAPFEPGALLQARSVRAAGEGLPHDCCAHGFEMRKGWGKAKP